jgi:hypothetical protein
MVPRVGLEPTRCHHHRILSPARLPIPPSRQWGTQYNKLFYGLPVSIKLISYSLQMNVSLKINVNQHHTVTSLNKINRQVSRIQLRIREISIRKYRHGKPRTYLKSFSSRNYLYNSVLFVKIGAGRGHSSHSSFYFSITFFLDGCARNDIT